MGQLKNAFEEFLSAEEFDTMFDDEYEMWLAQREAEQAAYEEMLSDTK